MIPFDFQPRTRVVFGAGKVELLGSLARELGGQRVLVVSDPGIIAAGHTQRGLDSLAAAGVDAHVFDGVRENPTTAEVDAGLAVAKEYQPDLIVGLGGGSSMDCAKGINFVYSCGGRMQDYWGKGKAKKPMLPMIAVPTTSGTGSETQSFALISDAETHVKMACGDPKAAFRVALLDPELTLTQPPHITAQTGIDAIAHALETYVTQPRNAASLSFSREAWLLLGGSFYRVIAEPDNLQARADMQLGACFAGLAIENSMLGATHALANPLTATFDVSHGQAIGMMLPHVIRYNGADAAVCRWYQDLLECTAGANGFPKPQDRVEGLAAFISELIQHAGLATEISHYDVPRDALETLSHDAAKQWTGTFNPRPVGQAELHMIYESAY
jgi:alcohol dehydrogenase